MNSYLNDEFEREGIAGKRCRYLHSHLWRNTVKPMRKVIARLVTVLAVETLTSRPHLLLVDWASYDILRNRIS